MARNELAGALQDVRKMKRSLRLRKEQDPEVVAETLTTVLREALAVRSASGGRLGKGAVNELKNIRQAMMAGQIDPGQRSAEFIGKYSAILDQMGNIEKESKEESKKGGQGIGQSIASNLPSADMITSAIITANPILGYTTKIAKDVFSSSKKRKQAQREIERQRLGNLEKEEQKLEEDHKEVEQDSVQDHEISTKLDMIREEIHKLVEIWSDSDDKLERIVEETHDSNVLERQTDSAGDLRDAERAFEGSDFGAGSIPTGNGRDAQGALEEVFDGQQGLFAGIGGVIGSTAGALASKMLAPFIGIINFIKRGGSILGRLGRVSGLITAAYALYDFVDGFISAEDILDKKESEISITDRIRAGASSVIAGLLAPVDWILDFVGMGFMESKDSFTKKLANSENELLQFFLSPGAWIVDYIREFDWALTYTKLANSFNAVVSTISDKFTEFKNDAGELISNIGWKETFDKIKDSLGETIEEIGNKFSDIGQAIQSWIDDKLEWFNDTWIGKRIDEIAKKITEGNELTRAIDGSAGGGRFGTAHSRGMINQQRALNEREAQTFDIGRPPNRISETRNITSQAISSALELADRNMNINSNNSGNTLIAPNNSSNNVTNNSIINPSSSAEDQDKSWRRSQMSGGFMAWPSR